MTLFELFHSAARPLLPPLSREIHARLMEFSRAHSNAAILDVGGRKSRCTIGVPARISVSDLPQVDELQRTLGLGFTDDLVRRFARQRSNVRHVVYDDMRNSSFGSEVFDCVLAMEVLEHVDRDQDFVCEVHRILKPGGMFLMTTPNGDWRPNIDPDHRRHYTRSQLESLLKTRFQPVDVDYDIAGGRFCQWGLKELSLQHPVQSALYALGNVLSGIQSRGHRLANQAHGTYELVAAARKGDGTQSRTG